MLFRYFFLTLSNLNLKFYNKPPKRFLSSTVNPLEDSNSSEITSSKILLPIKVKSNKYSENPLTPE